MSGIEIFEFEKKTLLQRLEEIESILCATDSVVPASAVRDEWSHFIEIAIEPAGWQALWKIPRVICEELGIPYPTVVFGVVEQVLFDTLKAVFTIVAVQDESVHLPEQHEVALQELWPTKEQENSALDIERTADCVDKLRFFYDNIFMPWDYELDDDQSWVQKCLRTRLAFYYDLKNKVIDRGMSARINQLIAEAHYIQRRKEYTELDLSDVEDDLTSSKGKAPPLTDLMRMHMRLNTIKNELEMLENPKMREIFKSLEPTGYKVGDSGTSCQAFVVAKAPSTLSQQLEFLNQVKGVVDDQQVVEIRAKLQDALTSANGADQIYLPTGKHSIKFLESLNGGGVIKAIALTSQSHPNRNGLDPAKDAVIVSQDDDSTLLTFDGDFCVENVVLDCRSVRSGLVIKSGCVRLKDCLVLGDDTSSTKKGIVVLGNSSLILENCVVKGFATGICANGEKVDIKQCTLEDCLVALEIDEELDLRIDHVDITNCKQYGVLIQSDQFESGVKTFKDFTELTEKPRAQCSNLKFGENKHGNVAIMGTKSSVFNMSSFADYDEGENSSYCSDLTNSVIVIDDSLIQVD